ncbi:MAG: FAD-dependent oxidoreductase [Gammaproteobacteria bacterium]|nr:FAD-dependent oxidoreductase [Gammaproteobacteria bacterium]MDJ0892059.1 FAD-dependent oxidoreductase [Gammaproteobacteria bacterium]
MSKVRNVALVGAGFCGAAIAHQLAKAGHAITVFEARRHVAGTCYTERDSETSVLVQAYGQRMPAFVVTPLA